MNTTKQKTDFEKLVRILGELTHSWEQAKLCQDHSFQHPLEVRQLIATELRSQAQEIIHGSVADLGLVALLDAVLLLAGSIEEMGIEA